MRTTISISLYCASSLLVAPTMALAQPAGATQTASADEGPNLDIVVTARKREERLQETPVAVSVVSQAQIQNYGLNNLASIAQFTPGLVVGETTGSAGASIYLRGIGSGESSPGVDQAVAINIDGVQISTGQVLRAGQFDTQQIEVLRGPQALFFGKNSPGGVISFTSADPKDELELMGRVGYEFKAREKYVEGVASGPLSDMIRVRLAGRYSDAKGYFKLTGTNTGGAFLPDISRFPEGEEWILRGTVVLEPTDRTKIRLKATYTERNGRGGPGFFIQRIACPYGAPQASAPIDNCKKDGEVFGGNIPQDARARDIAHYGTDPVGFRTNDQLLLSAGIDQELTDSLTLTSTTGYYKVNDANGTSTSIEPAITIISWGQFSLKQFSQELRLTSNNSGPLNFMFGGFYETKKIYNAGGAFLRLLNRSLPDEIGRFKNDAYSVFGQVMFDVTDQFEISAGGRYTHEKREVTSFTVDGVGGPLDVAPLLPRNKRTFNNFSPELTLTYKPDQDLMLFASYKRGFKSGGFDASLTSGGIRANPARGLDYAPEKVKGFEGGFKSTLLDRSLLFNVTAYWYDYSDLQVTAFDPIVIALKIVNAAKARIRGIEAETVWSPRNLDGFSMRASATYNDAKYRKYLADCYTGQTVALGCNQVLNPATGRFTSQDLSGRQMNRAPKFTASLGFNYEVEVAEGIGVGLSSDTAYSSSYQGGSQFQPLGHQSAYAKTDASLRVFDTKDRWEVAFIGRNLTDKYTIVRSFDTTLRGSGKGGTADILSDVSANVSRGREMRIQLTLRN